MLEERKEEFKNRVKQKTIKHIFLLMKREGIVLEDLQDYTPGATLMERVLERRRIEKKKAQHRESLKKARQAKEEKHS